MSTAVFFEYEKDAFKSRLLTTLSKQTGSLAAAPLGSRRVKWMCAMLLLACAFTASRVVLQMMSSPSPSPISWVSVQQKVREDLKRQIDDPGFGCDIPVLNPFVPEIVTLQRYGDLKNITCPGKDWVNCHLNVCRVDEEILRTVRNIKCIYKDILRESDSKYSYGAPVHVYGGDPYYLVESDQVLVECGGKKLNELLFSFWSGPKLGFRYIRKPPASDPNKYNVLFIGFDSVSRNRFIREMPNSYKKLHDMDAVILKGYNIVGDGTPANLIPILTGVSPVDLPDARRAYTKEGVLDSWPFIFHELESNGYRTFYTEDSPDYGTFQYRYSGFVEKPSEHYWFSFYKEALKTFRWYCIGDTPTYLHMFNIAKQFFKLDGNKYGMAFSGDISHDRPSQLFVADDDLVALLSHFRDSGHLEDTMLIVFADHGPRYDDIRNTLQGRMEERMPLMAILLPERLKRTSPRALENLKANAAVLTTPHDIFATTAHVTRLGRKGSDFAYSLLDPIPFTRNCADARVESHWCVCLRWHNVSRAEPVYNRTASALLEHINGLTEPYRNKCAIRQLAAIWWVMRNTPDGNLRNLKSDSDIEKFQVRITTEPGHATYEASMTFVKSENTFVIRTDEISRTTAYNDDPSCISEVHPELNSYCYCYQKNVKKTLTTLPPGANDI